MVCTKLHCCVDALCGSNAVSQDANCFIDHRDQNSVDNESRSLSYFYRSLLQAFCCCDYCVLDFIGSCDALNDLDQLHCRNRVEEVHADDLCRSGCNSRDLCDGECGCVGCQDRVVLADLVQLCEQFLFLIHVLCGRLDDQIAVCQNIKGGTAGDPSQCSSLVILGDLLSGDHLGQVLVDLSQSAVNVLLLAASDDYIIASCRTYLNDAGSHCTCSHNANFLHNIFLLSQSLRLLKY